MTGRKQQQAAFERNGFVVIPDIISASELQRVRKMSEGVLDGTIKPDRQPSLEDFHIQWEPRVKNDSTLSRRDMIRVVFHLAHTHSYFWELATRDAILDAVENLIGPQIKLYSDQMFVKPAHHGTEVPYHHDSAYWPFADPGLVSCWLAIDDSTIDNGCVCYVPGSHLEDIPHQHIDTDLPNRTGAVPGVIDPSREVPVQLEAGSACIHHSLTVHRSAANRSGRSRRGWALIYYPAGMRFEKPRSAPYDPVLVRTRSRITT